MTHQQSTLFKTFARDFAVVLAIFAVIGLGPALIFSNKAQRDISRTYIEQSTERAANEFQIIGTATANAVRIVRQWAQSGLLELDNPDGMNHLLFPLMLEDKQHHGISVADTEGRSYFITDSSGQLTTSYTRSKGGERQDVNTTWDGDQVIEQVTVTSDYDPRSRPWFYPSLGSDEVYWTDAYIFYDHKVVGVTASSSVQIGKPEGYQMVVAFDLSLHGLYTEIQAMQPSPNSQVMILRRDESLYTVDPENGAAFTALSESSNELARKAHSAWRSTTEEQKIVSIRHDGRNWWCGFRPLSKENNTWIGVTVPEEDTIEGVSERRSMLLIFGLFSVLAAGGLAFFLAKRQQGSGGGPTVPFDPQQATASVRDIISRGESKRREFKSTMRVNLHTNKPGKEIETAWLKGVAAFLNTDGGTLLLGVNDAGEITGLEVDKFESEDHCQLHFKNLIAQQIGAEFSKYIEFRTVRIDEKLVGIAECQRSNEPVFLKHAKGESFFIRNGPSSDELPVSQALDYIKARK
ncbi:MAG: RNA-binding domain-containing protein [Coraliomargarita sp.]